jgi:hypothetical protein
VGQDAAKLAPKTRLSQSASTTLRKANADPRMITPNAARVSGMTMDDKMPSIANGSPKTSP